MIGVVVVILDGYDVSGIWIRFVFIYVCVRGCGWVILFLDEYFVAFAYLGRMKFLRSFEIKENNMKILGYCFYY